MNVGQVIELARGWVEVYGSQKAGFCGAHLMGGLQECATAFDRATEVTRTPIPLGHKLQPYVKPYLVEGAREMIDEGCHREAVLWIYGFLWISNTAIQMDAPEDEKPQFQMKINQLTSDLDLRTSQDMEARCQQAKELTDSIFKAADLIVSQNPEIIE